MQKLLAIGQTAHVWGKKMRGRGVICHLMYLRLRVNNEIAEPLKIEHNCRMVFLKCYGDVFL